MWSLLLSLLLPFLLNYYFGRKWRIIRGLFYVIMGSLTLFVAFFFWQDSRLWEEKGITTTAYLLTDNAISQLKRKNTFKADLYFYDQYGQQIIVKNCTVNKQEAKALQDKVGISRQYLPDHPTKIRKPIQSQFIGLIIFVCLGIFILLLGIWQWVKLRRER